MMWQDVQECPDQIEAFPCNVGDLEHGAYPLADELRCGLDSLVVVFDEDGYLLGSRGFQYAGQLGDCLLQDLGRTDVDFGYDYHDWYIQRQGDTQMLPGCFCQRSGQFRFQ